MKRFRQLSVVSRQLLILALFAAFAVQSSAQAPTAPAIGPMPVTPAAPSAAAPCDAKVDLPDGSSLLFSSTDRTPQGRAAAIRRALGRCQSGSVLRIAAGQFDLTPTAAYPSGVVWPNNVTIVGMGRKATHLYGIIESDTKGAMFTVQNNEIRSLTMEVLAAGTPMAQGFEQSDPRCVGFDYVGNVTASAKLLTPPPYATRISDCDIKGPAWTIYSWSDMQPVGKTGIANTLVCEDCEISSARLCVAMMSSGYGQDFTFKHCTLIGNAGNVFSVGAISQAAAQSGVFGVVCMGGKLKLDECTMRLTGAADQVWPGIAISSTQRVCGVTDAFGYAGSGAAANTTITIKGLDCQIAPNGSDPTKCFDLDFKTATTRQQARIAFPGCLGSNADGTLTKSY